MKYYEQPLPSCCPLLPRQASCHHAISPSNSRGILRSNYNAIGISGSPNDQLHDQITPSSSQCQVTVRAGHEVLITVHVQQHSRKAVTVHSLQHIIFCQSAVAQN